MIDPIGRVADEAYAAGRAEALADVIAHLRDRSLHLDPTAAARHADWIERELGGERGE